MVDCVASPAVSDLLPGARLAGVAHPNHCCKERRDPRSAPWGDDPAQAEPEAALVLARPRPARRADPAPAQAITDLAAGDPGDRAHLAPPTGRQEMDLPEPRRPTQRGRRTR